MLGDTLQLCFNLEDSGQSTTTNTERTFTRQSELKFGKYSAKQHTTPLLSGLFVILVLVRSLKLQQMERLAYHLLIHFQVAEGPPICLQIQVVRKHEHYHLTSLMRTGLDLVDVLQLQLGGHSNCCTKYTGFLKNYFKYQRRNLSGQLTMYPHITSRGYQTEKITYCEDSGCKEVTKIKHLKHSIWRDIPVML